MSKLHCWKPCLITEGSLSRLSITLPWLLLQIPRSFHFARFSQHPQMLPKSSHLHPIPHHNLTDPSCSLSSPNSSIPKKSIQIFSISPSQRGLWVSLEFLLLTLCESVHCGIIILYLTANVYLQVSIYHVCPSGSRLPHSTQTMISFFF